MDSVDKRKLRRERRRERKKIRKALKKAPGFSNHHIIPSSRGGKTTPENIACVEIKSHTNYHRLFTNKTPEEIIAYLVKEFWGGSWQFVDNALVKALSFLGGEDE